MRKTLAKCALALMVLLATVPVLIGQGTTGIILGVVRDQSGAVLPGVTIQVTDQETGRVRTTLTEANGIYRVAALELGAYSVQAAVAGFRTVRRSGVILTVGMEAVVDLKMEVGQVSESVTVSAEAGLVQATSAELASLVGDKEIRDLPLNGRSYDALVLLQPGVSKMTNFNNVQASAVLNGAGPKLSIAGTPFDMTAFLLDGTDIHDHTNFGSGSAAGTNLGVDSILEFSVLTQNYSTQFGRVAGGIINAVTRGGTNSLHGGAFEFLRNSKLDAREFFDQGEIPAFRRNQFGGFAGGSVLRDRTFFFVNYEGLRERKARTLISSVPDASARQGIVPGLGTIAVAPNVRPYLDLYPFPNGRNFGDGTGEFLWTFNIPTREDYGSARIDYQLSEKQYFFGRLTIDDAEKTGPRDLPQWADPSSSRSTFSILEVKTILSPQMLNVFRFAFNRTNPFIGGSSTLPNDPQLTFVRGSLWRLAFTTDPSVGSAPVSQLGHEGVTPSQFAQNTFQVGDDFDWHRGRHSMRMGFNLERFQNNNSQAVRNGEFDFTDLASFLRAQPSLFFAGSPGTPTGFSYRQWMPGFYFQDDVRVNDKLNLNLGLRYEFINNPTENNGLIGTVVHPLTDTQATNGVPAFRDNPSLGAVAPRFGFAWSPLGGGKSVVRGGFGIYYNQILGRLFYSYANGATRANIRAARNLTFPDIDVAALAALGVPDVNTFDPNINTPTIYHYNLTVEHQLPFNTVVRLGYAGSQGLHLARQVEADTRAPNFLPDGTPFYTAAAPRINPNFNGLPTIRTDALNNYNAFELNIVKRVSRGLRFQASYTFSRTITESGPFQGPQTTSTASISQIAFNRKNDRSLAATHRKQVLVVNYSYAFPGESLRRVAGALLKGWETNGIFTAEDGLPFTAGLSFSRSNDLSRILADRPNLAPGRSNNPVLGGPDQYFDPTAFALQPLGFYGNLGRNTLIGPGLTAFDFSIAKNFALRERQRLQFRAEFFNALNRANFGLPNRTVFTPRGLSGNAGRITDLASSSREIQLGLRYTF